MNVYIRADASVRIGTGHIYRCLSLADELERLGASVTFVCRELEGNLLALVEERGYRIAALRELSTASADSWLVDAKLTSDALAASREPVDWLVVDHYGLDARFERIMRSRAKRIMVVDDLADRPHDCDLLLDQNAHASPESRYAGLLANAKCRQLFGPAYALLRAEFARRRADIRRDGRARSALISFGGADTAGMTLTAVRALAPLAARGLALTAIAGKLNPDAAAIEALCAELPNARFHAHADHIAALMAEADVAVGAGGTTTWERCCLGLPALVVAIADNQLELAKEAERAGAIRYLGEAAQVDEPAIREAAERLMNDSETLSRMSAAAMRLTDGRGAERVAKEMWAIR